MLKPIDKTVSIQEIKLQSKTGGKSDKKKYADKGLNAAVIVCSDTIAAGKAEDSAGKAVVDALEALGVSVPVYGVIPDEAVSIRDVVLANTKAQHQLLILVGGTGVSPRDITPDILRPMLQKELPGIMEAARNYGQDRMPYAMLSRSIAGLIDNTLVLRWLYIPK